MKRLFTAALLLLVCVSAWAVQIETGTNGQKVSANNPLAVNLASTAVSIATSDTPQTTGTSSVVLLTATPQEIAAIATQRDLFLLATGTFQYGLGSFPAAIANRQGVYNVSIPGRLSVSVWTTATPTYLNVDKLGD